MKHRAARVDKWNALETSEGPFLAPLELKRAGREHLTLWLSPSELQKFCTASTFEWTQPAEIDGIGPFLPRTDIRSGQVAGLSCGRLNLRSTASFLDSDPTMEEIDRWAIETDSLLKRAGGGLKSSCGASASSIMREPPVSSWASTEVLDFGRAAIHGGFLRAHRGLYLAPGAEDPGIPTLATIRCDAPIHHIDIKSAYPWALCKPLPVGSSIYEPVSPPSPSDLRLDVDGVSQVTIELNGCSPVLSVRVLHNGRVETRWPRLGTYGPLGGAGATFSHSALHEATRTGAKITAVHRTIYFRRSRPWASRYSVALRSMERQSEGLTHEGIRRAGRALWGKLVQGRIRTEWIKKSELEGTPGIVRLRTSLGDWTECEFNAETYPSTVHPFAGAVAMDLISTRVQRAISRIEAQGGTIIYVDTDGIHYSGPSPSAVVTIGEKIGDWREKPKGGFSWVAVFSSKMYLTNDAAHKALGGVPIERQEEWITGRVRNAPGVDRSGETGRVYRIRG